jgi:hypothetical protein
VKWGVHSNKNSLKKEKRKIKETRERRVLFVLIYGTFDDKKENKNNKGHNNNNNHH